MIKSGLCSISFRNLSPEETVDMSSKAGIEGIEWGGDIHVPHGDLKTAKNVRLITENGGIALPSYGSYYKVGISEGEGLSFNSVLDTAGELGVSTIRVWTRIIDYAKAEKRHIEEAIDDTLRIAELAGAEDLTIAYEFHHGTLLDSKEAAAGTIRGDLGTDMMENVCHASDGPETAAVELKRFFNEGELF